MGKRSSFTVAACATPDIQGDVSAALMCIIDRAQEAADADILLFPEGFLQGFTRDEADARARAFDLTSNDFQSRVLDALQSCRPMLVFGLIETNSGLLYNTAVVVHDGQLVGSYRKQNIHSSEHIFRAGHESPVFEHHGLRFGTNICYDARFPESAAKLAEQKVDLILYPLNNMHEADVAERWRYRHVEFLTERAKQTGAWVVSADVTGRRDDLIGYGSTAIFGPAGRLLARVPELKQGIVMRTL